jgi:hypothetical protein
MKGTEQMRVGDKLANGATVIAFFAIDDRMIVAAKWHGDQYVTWRVDEKGNAFLGHYFTNRDDAINDLKERW